MLRINPQRWIGRVVASTTATSAFFNATAAKRFMSKYLSKAATKRLPLITKHARKGFYKGNRATKEGRITSKGRFIVDPLKRLQLIVPDLEGFKLKPYIAATVPKFPPETRREVGTVGPR